MDDKANDGGELQEHERIAGLYLEAAGGEAMKALLAIADDAVFLRGLLNSVSHGYVRGRVPARAAVTVVPPPLAAPTRAAVAACRFPALAFADVRSHAFAIER